MATTCTNYYATATGPITITLAALAANACRASVTVNNATTKYLDAAINFKYAVTQSGTDQAIYIYGYGSTDGLLFPEDLTGADAAPTYFTSTPPNLPLIAVIGGHTRSTHWNTPTNYYIASVAQAFNGNLPLSWGIVVDNRAGAFSPTTAHFDVSYIGLYNQAG